MKIQYAFVLNNKKSYIERDKIKKASQADIDKLLG